MTTTAKNMFATNTTTRSLEDELEQVLNEFAPNDPRQKTKRTTGVHVKNVNRHVAAGRGVHVDSDSDEYQGTTASTATDSEEDTGTFSTLDDYDNLSGDDSDKEHVKSGAFVAPPAPPPRTSAYHVSRDQMEHERNELLSEQRQRYGDSATGKSTLAGQPLIRNGWDAIANVNDCVSDLEREMSALMCHHRKQCQVSRRALQECDDRIKWLDDLQSLVERERASTVGLREVLAHESSRSSDTEAVARQLSQSQKTLSEKDFFPLDLEEVRVDTRLKKLDDDAAELREVLSSLKDRETNGKTRQKELHDREMKVRRELDEVEKRDRRRRQMEVGVQERERTSTRHESAIDTWSRTLDVRETECQQRRAHLDKCFQALEKAETVLNVSSSSPTADGDVTAQKKQQQQQQQGASVAPASMPKFSHPSSTNAQQPQSDQQQKQQKKSTTSTAGGGGDESMNQSMTMNKTTSAMIGSALPHMSIEPEALALDEDDEDEDEL